MRNKKKWLVTGSAGFIGSNLCETLLENAQDVIGLDNFSTGKQENINRINSNFTNFTFYKGSILDKNLLKEIMKDIDVVVHLAAQGSVQKSFSKPLWNNEHNINGFLNVLMASHESNVKQFIYASSCSIYGDTDILPITESHSPNPLSPYATSKLANDMYSENLRDSLNPMNVCGLRFFNIFGSYQDPNGAYAAVIPKWVDDCIKNKQPIIFSNGNQTRDFCHVKNVCNLILNMPKKANGVFNISSGVSISLNDLFLTIYRTIIKSGLELSFSSAHYEPARAGDIMHSLGSSERAIRELNFSNNINLEDGISFILKDQYDVSI